MKNILHEAFGAAEPEKGLQRARVERVTENKKRGVVGSAHRGSESLRGKGRGLDVRL